MNTQAPTTHTSNNRTLPGLVTPTHPLDRISLSPIPSLEETVVLNFMLVVPCSSLYFCHLCMDSYQYIV